MNLLEFPTTLLEFEGRFATERACWEFVRGVKWPNGYRCPKCPGRKSYFVIERGLDECAACGHQTSTTAGTMFHGTRQPLMVWFRAIFEFVRAKNGCNAMHLQRILGLSYETAWTWLHKIRDTFVRPGRELLTGGVEADETYVGGPEEGVSGRACGEKKTIGAADRSRELDRALRVARPVADDRWRREQRPGLVVLDDFYHLGPQLRREIDEIALG